MAELTLRYFREKRKRNNATVFFKLLSATKILFRKKILSFITGCSILFLLQGCLKDKLTKTYTVYEPVYRTRAEVLADIKSNAPERITTPGKIYQFGNYIFLN